MKLVEENNQQWAEMPALPDNFPTSSYAQATKITSSFSDPTNAAIYKVDIKLDWSISTRKLPCHLQFPDDNINKILVPHGGYLLSIASLSAQKYMQTHHAKLKQPDLITSHVEFLSRSSVGPASLRVSPLKLGRQFSSLRVQLFQNDPKTKSPRICLEALITQGNLAAEARSPNASISLPVRPLSSHFSVSKREDCELWNHDPRWPARRPAAWKIAMYLPPNSQDSSASPTYGPSVREQWVRWATPSIGTHFTIDSLPYLADSFRPLPEAYGLVGNWYATLSYGVEVKRAPDGEGWEWLFVRIEMGEVINGRYGMDVWILDEQERVVARSWHTALIMGMPGKNSRVVEGAKI